MFQTLQKSLVGLTRNTYLLALASVFTDLSTEMLYPILPIYLTQYFNAGGSILGLVEGCAIATQNMIQGFSGWFSDYTRQYKKVALMGYFLAAIAKPLYAFVFIWQGVLVARVIDRLGTGIRSAPRDALVASSVEAKNRGKAFGLESFGDNLGACLGPLFLMALLSLFFVDIRTLFYIAFIPSITAFFIIGLIQTKDTVVKAPPSPLLVTTFTPMYWKYLRITALFGLGNSSNAFLILKIQQLGGSLLHTIITYALYNFIAALVSYPAGYLSDTLGRKQLLLFSYLAFFITYLGFALSTQFSTVLILFAIYGVYQGIYRAVGKALAVDLVPESLQASGIGWYSATIGILGLISSIIAGILWDKINPSAVFYFGATFAAMGSVALWFFSPNLRE